MTQPFQQQNEIPNEPTLKDLLDLHKKDIFLTLNCHAIGVVQSFNSTKQTATVTIAYKRTRFERDTSGNYVPVLREYPVLVDAPVVFLGGGTASLTFPVTANDECLVFFNDRDLDNWFNGAPGGAVDTQRAHSFADAVILVGVRSLANVLTGFDGTRAVLQMGQALVGVGGGAGTKVKVANNSFTLNGLLQNILTQLTNLTTAIAAITVTGVTSGSGSSGIPANALAITAIGTNLTTLATELGTLLE